MKGMIYLFHGVGTVAMLNRVSAIKKNFSSDSIIELSSKNSDMEDIKLALQSVSLFEEKKLLILEDFQNLKLEELPLNENTTLVLKFSKALAANSSLLKETTKFRAQISLFSEEKETSLFPFLDALAEKNSKALIELQKNLDEWGVQYVLVMIFYMLRRMVLPPGRNLPPFVLKKMEGQKRNFPRERLNYFYRKTLETDFKIKSGLAEERLALFSLVEEFLR